MSPTAGAAASAARSTHGTARPSTRHGTAAALAGASWTTSASLTATTSQWARRVRLLLQQRLQLLHVATLLFLFLLLKVMLVVLTNGPRTVVQARAATPTASS